MKYLNPFFLLDVAPEALEAEPMATIKARKQELLAEFELHETATLNLHGKEIDKAGLLFLLSELEDETHRAFHTQVYHNDPLRRFLEEGEVAALDQVDEVWQGNWQGNRELVAFVAPHFARQYNAQLYHAVKHQNAAEVVILAQVELPFSPKWIAQCYQDTYRFLVYQLKEAQSMDRKVQVVASYGPLLEQLPGYFDTVRNMYKPYREAADFAQLTEEFDGTRIKQILWVGLGLAAAIALFRWFS